MRIDLRQATIGAIAILGLYGAEIRAQVQFPPALPSNAPVMSYPARNSDNVPLPPPPSIIPSLDAPPSAIPDFTPPSNPTISPQMVYRVEVRGNDPFVLSQVQTLAPDAFARQGDNMIQVGSFSDRFNAQRQVETLASQGIRANVVEAYVTPSPAPFSSGIAAWENSPSKLAPNFISETQRQNLDSGRFFVVIPGRDATQLQGIAQQALALGVQSNAIQTRSEPLGLHLAVGPFASRSEAEVWNTRLRSNGLDARLHFR